mgnify:FL=1
MLGIVSFTVSIISVIMSFFTKMLLPAFITAMGAIIIAVISAYHKDIDEKEKDSNHSRALEVGTVVISAATILSYFVFTIIA